MRIRCSFRNRLDGRQQSSGNPGEKYPSTDFTVVATPMFEKDSCPIRSATLACLVIGIVSLAFGAITANPLRADDMTGLAWTVEIASSYDGTRQPAVVYLPPTGRDSSSQRHVPLLVVLHTWSGDYRQKGWIGACLAECRRRRWAMIHPDFRGPNWTPEACASPAARQDILDAVEYMKRKTRINSRRIYLVGTSGGGHMSLVMAAHTAQVWAGVSAWVPITDLAAWHGECRLAGLGYADHMEKACGGAPGDSAVVDQEYRARSSLPFLTDAAKLAIDINTGIDDGHPPATVPISHSLRAFNALAVANGLDERQLTTEEIALMTTKRQIPSSLKGERLVEPDRKHAILFRRNAGPARITVFEGGHTADMPTAIKWLARQR